VIIYLGIPMYGGAHGLTVSCLLSLQKHLITSGHEVITDIVANGSILTKVRNGIVKRFIESKANKLLFLDSDMVFEPEQVAKLINAQFDVSIINYRAKHNQVKYFSEPILKDGEPTGVCIDGEAWLETEQGGTGIMCISRKAITEMIAAYPELTYKDNGPTPALFDFQLKDGQYYGEDYTFCQRFRAIGGQIFMLADAETGHIGTTVYHGNYHDYLRGH